VLSVLDACDSLCVHVNRQVRRMVVMVCSREAENGDDNEDEDEDDDDDEDEDENENEDEGDMERMAEDWDEEAEGFSSLSEHSKCSRS
jgi:hypothetical protein